MKSDGFTNKGLHTHDELVYLGNIVYDQHWRSSPSNHRYRFFATCDMKTANFEFGALLLLLFPLHACSNNRFRPGVFHVANNDLPIMITPLPKAMKAEFQDNGQFVMQALALNGTWQQKNEFIEVTIANPPSFYYVLQHIKPTSNRTLTQTWRIMGPDRLAWRMAKKANSEEFTELQFVRR